MLTFCNFLEKLLNHYTSEKVCYVKLQKLVLRHPKLKDDKKSFFHRKCWCHLKKLLIRNLRYDSSRDLVPFVQFKKIEKHQRRSVTFSKVVLFKNCTNGAKLRKASHIYGFENAFGA